MKKKPFQPFKKTQRMDDPKIEELRSKGLCFKERWSPGHVCNLKKGVATMILMDEGENKDDSHDIEEWEDCNDEAHDESLEDRSFITEDGEFLFDLGGGVKESLVDGDMPTNAEISACICSISQELLAGCKNPSTLRLVGTIHGRVAHILVDSGSTQSFINS
ncbi:hypothetical protein HX137_32240, partial [Pseudomonas sp. 165]|uniref:hypothetical protein n=1 Tax=Pseudomonas sp. 165 TaxID=2746722 RepID=UPI002575BBDF